MFGHDPKTLTQGGKFFFIGEAFRKVVYGHGVEIRTIVGVRIPDALNTPIVVCRESVVEIVRRGNLFLNHEGLMTYQHTM